MKLKQLIGFKRDLTTISVFYSINNRWYVMQSKPNVLINTNDPSEFATLKSYFQSLLGKQAYTFYHLNNEDFLNLNPNIWKSTCILLIACEQAGQPCEDRTTRYLEYVRSGGALLSLPSNALSNEFTQHDQIKYYPLKFPFESTYAQTTNTNLSLNIFQKFLNLTPKSDDLLYYFSNENNNGLHFVSKVSH